MFNGQLAQFYECVRELAEEKRQCSRSLAEYLRAIYGLIWREQRVMNYSVLYDLYQQSFESEPVAFDDAWIKLTRSPERPEDAEGSRELALETIAFLIADLRRMDKAGILSLDPSIIYGGIDSPTGNRWYNFDSSTFIECGARGARDLVGNDRETELSTISWSEVASIIELGRDYE